MATQTTTSMRELDSRTSDGISVRLLWHEPDGKLFVAVADSKTGDTFDVEVRDRDRERTREVFHHPFAYAAWYGVATRKTA
ncbi:MAG: hypothetical protein M3065_21660 [Actinomycetota bacterium]|nr:hypothetical protein [Actinomycetota bacterium]